MANYEITCNSMAMPVSHFSASAGLMGSCNFLFCFLRALGQSPNRCLTTSGREATSWRICVGVRCFLYAGHGGIINLGVDSPCHTSESLCTRLFLDNKNHSGVILSITDGYYDSIKHLDSFIIMHLPKNAAVCFPD